MSTQNETSLQRLISRFEKETTLVFKPSRRFYQSTGINRVRFAQLTNGDKQLSLNEASILAGFFSKFFPVSIQDFIQS